WKRLKDNKRLREKLECFIDVGSVDRRRYGPRGRRCLPCVPSQGRPGKRTAPSGYLTCLLTYCRAPAHTKQRRTLAPRRCWRWRTRRFSGEAAGKTKGFASIVVTGAKVRARTRTRDDAANAKLSQKNHLQAHRPARIQKAALLPGLLPLLPIV